MYRLYTRAFYDTFEDYDPPEMLTQPLEQVSGGGGPYYEGSHMYEDMSMMFLTRMMID